MGFNKMYVPELPELKEKLEANPKLLNYFHSADSLVGPADSMAYLKEQIQKKFGVNK